MGTHKNCLNETVLLSTQNTCLGRWIIKALQFFRFKTYRPIMTIAVDLGHKATKANENWFKIFAYVSL